MQSQFNRKKFKTLPAGKILVFGTAFLFFFFIPAASLSAGTEGKSPREIFESPPEDRNVESKGDPGTRKEVLHKLRREKALQTSEPRQGFLEKYLNSLDQRAINPAEEANFIGFYPRFDIISRGSGPAVGIRYWRPDSIGSLDFMGSAFYSIRQYQHYDFKIGLIPHIGRRIPHKSFAADRFEELAEIDRSRFSKLKLYGSTRFRDRTDDSFYGSGPESKKEDLIRYRLKEILAEGVIGYQLNRNLGFTWKTGFVGHSLDCGRSSPNFCEMPGAPGIPGLAEPPNFVRIHTNVIYDRRDNPGNPHRGFMVALGWEKWDNKNTGDSFNFHRTLADIRGYIPLGSRQRVLAVRGFFVNSDPGPDSRVPFFLQPSLGGGETLRGYDSFRFRGDKLALVQAEYRWEASRRLELALFGDAGTVANQGNRLSKHHIKSDAGIGFRLKTTDSTFIRIDQAFSNEGPKTQFRFSVSF